MQDPLDSGIPDQNGVIDGEFAEDRLRVTDVSGVDASFEISRQFRASSVARLQIHGEGSVDAAATMMMTILAVEETIPLKKQSSLVGFRFLFLGEFQGRFRGQRRRGEVDLIRR